MNGNFTSGTKQTSKWAGTVELHWFGVQKKKKKKNQK